VLTCYEFQYQGPALPYVHQTIAAWCASHDCVLEVTSLLRGARFRVSGRDDAVRHAIRMVSVWIRRAA
jgi:hypothetical protein